MTKRFSVEAVDSKQAQRSKTGYLSNEQAGRKYLGWIMRIDFQARYEIFARIGKDPRDIERLGMPRKHLFYALIATVNRISMERGHVWNILWLAAPAKTRAESLKFPTALLGGRTEECLRNCGLA